LSQAACCAGIFPVPACFIYDKRSASCVAVIAGSIKDIKWSNVKVGQVLKVYDDEDFPADLLCLFCNLADNVCYIKTTNLDGAPQRAVTRRVGTNLPRRSGCDAPKKPSSTQDLSVSGCRQPRMRAALIDVRLRDGNACRQC